MEDPANSIATKQYLARERSDVARGETLVLILRDRHGKDDDCAADGG